MSWDVVLLNLTRVVKTAAELSADEVFHPLGSSEFTQNAISKIFTATDWTDPAWGRYSSDEGSIEFNMGKEDPVESIMFHVRAGSGIVPLILALCEDQGWCALDVGTGEFLDQSPDAIAGLESWRAYRDKVISQNDA